MKPSATLHWEQPDDPVHMATAYLRKVIRWGASLRLVEMPHAEGNRVTVGLGYPGTVWLASGTVTSILACEPHGHVLWVQFAEPIPTALYSDLIHHLKPLIERRSIDVPCGSHQGHTHRGVDAATTSSPKPRRRRRREPENWDGFEC